jgi:glycosyltransferase involved in cell wall biosynthesis
MRLAFYDVTVSISIGGIQTAVWELAPETAVRGHRVHVYGGRGTVRPADLQPSIEVFTFPYLSRNRVPDLGSRFQRIVGRLSMTPFTRGPLRAGAYELIFLTKPFDFFVPFLLGETSKTHYAFMGGGTDCFAGDRLLASRIDIWLACSHFNAEQVQTRYKRYPKVVYNKMDVDRFKPMPQDLALKQRLGVHDGEVVFTIRRLPGG